MKPRKPMPITEELMQDTRWVHLTPQQKAFCRIVAETSDPTLAMQTVYNVSSAESARVKSYAILAHPRVKAFLNLLYQLTPDEIALEDCEQTIRSRKASRAEKRDARRVRLEILRGNHA
jgi:hypothetical protein